MSNIKISELPAATTPLSSQDVVPVVQSGTTKKVSISEFGASSSVGGATAFTQLTDVPATYAGASNQFVKVNVGESGLTFAGGGSATLSDGDYGDILVSGAGTAMTYDGVVPVNKGGTGQTTEAEALGEMIQALPDDLAPNSATDYLVTYCSSADTGRKVLIANMPGIALPVAVADGGTGQITAAEAIGELTQALTEDTNPDYDIDFMPIYNATADTGSKVKLQTAMRRKLQANTTFYVRAAPQTCTMTATSPCVVTAGGHGLSANDPIVFDWPTQRNDCTVSIGSPAIISCNNHGFVAGDAVCFRTTGALPTNLPSHIINTADPNDREFCPFTYYVIAAGLTASQFEVSLTPGGAAINTAGGQSGTHMVERARFIQLPNTCTFAGTTVTSVGHGLVANEKIAFCGTGVQLNNVHHYGEDWDYFFVKTVLGPDTFSISTTAGGAAIDVSGAEHTGTEYVFKLTPMLEGIQHGETYYVLATGLTGGTFQFSLTPAGAAINTTGTTTGVVRVQTGNDANNGSDATRAGAWLTLQHAYDAVCLLDFNGYAVTIQLADGVYWEDVNNLLLTPDTWVGGGDLTIQGNSLNKNNVRMEMATDIGDIFAPAQGEASGGLHLNYLDFYNPSFTAMNCFRYNAGISIFDWTLSGFALDDPHIYIQGNGLNERHSIDGTIDVLWGAGLTSGGITGSILAISAFLVGNTPTYRLFNDPVFQKGLVHCEFGGYYRAFGDTWTGTYTGSQGFLDNNESTLYEQFTTIPGTPLVTSGLGERYKPQSNIEYRYTRNLKYDGFTIDDNEPILDLTLNSTNPANFTPNGYIGFNAYNSGAVLTNYAYIQGAIGDKSSGSEDGYITIFNTVAGLPDVEQMTIASGIIIGNYTAVGTEPGHNWIGIKSSAGLKDGNANEQLVLNTGSSAAVNFWRMTNSSAGGIQRLDAAGDDTNIEALLASKGTDQVSLECNAVTELSVTTSGAIAGKHFTARSTTAIPAGGSSAAPAYLLSATAGFGVYFGSGAPGAIAAQGSLYLRSDGTSSNTRMYVNTAGSSVWTSVLTSI